MNAALLNLSYPQTAAALLEDLRKTATEDEYLKTLGRKMIELTAEGIPAARMEALLMVDFGVSPSDVVKAFSRFVIPVAIKRKSTF